MRKLRIEILTVILLTGCACCAELSFAPIFNDGAVLQCELPVNLWGKAEAGTDVEIRLDGQKVASVLTDADGIWGTVLPKQNPGGAHVIEALSGADSAKINGVWFGEVWLATGQSNMEVPLNTADGGAEQLIMTLPEIRFLRVLQQTGLPVEKEFTATDLAWKTFAPPANQQIAAVAFYFAKQIQQKTGRRIGIIQCSYGGTPCEAWTPAWALDEKPELKYLSDAIRTGLAAWKTKEQWQTESAEFMKYWYAFREWSKEKKGAAPQAVPQPGPDNPWDSKSPTVLYENMLRPLIPYTARGVIWYQGEGNTGKPEEYRILFPTMIAAWRTAWNRPDWPFFFVQISSFDDPDKTRDWPGLRDAQTFTRDTVPHTGMAVSIDCGEKTNIHPRAKQPVGERLARLALADVYGQDIVSRGPGFQALKKKDGKVRVIFQYSEKGLQTSDGEADVPGFEVAGTDELFHPAQGKIISSNTVELTCGAVSNPVSVRYAWANWPEPPVTLQNSAGLPAEPFKTQ